MENMPLYNKIDSLPETLKREVLDFMEFLLQRNKKRPYDDKPLVESQKSPPSRERKLGILESKASFVIKDDFKITDEEFLSL
ncbi:MAG: DUF2281 domain-containing protein [bacterium]|nr:DUF2281 domain-containing protein [bacterium]